jgi:hypothetical protein
MADELEEINKETLNKIDDQINTLNSVNADESDTNNTKEKRKEKVKSIAKKAAKGTGKAIGATARHGGNALDSLGGGVGLGGLFFVLVVIAMIIDISTTKLIRSGGNLVVAAAIYFGLAIVYWLVNLIHNSEGSMKEKFTPLFIGIGLGAAQILLSGIFSQYLPELFPSAFTFGLMFPLIMLTSPWLLFFIFIDPMPSKLTHIVKILWFFVVVFTLLILTLPILFSSVSNLTINTEVAVSPVDAFGDYMAMLKNKIGETKTAIEEGLNAKLRPANAKSEIDKNSNERLGVFLKDLKTMESRTIEDKQVSMTGTLEASSLFNEMKIITSCYGENIRNDSLRYPGHIGQSMFYVLGKDKQPLFCEFPNGFDKGRYNLFFDAGFNFETWAYLDYTFVDDSTYKDYFIQNKDINDVLQIEEEPMPVFTDGPVQISLLAISQPLRVDFENENKIPKFGVYIDKYWTRGDIEFIKELNIQMPQMLSLENCNVEPEFFGNEEPDTNEASDYFTYYRFTNLDEESGKLETIYCDMIIDQDDYYMEKGASEKIIKTVVVNAKYQFSVTSSPTLLNVKEKED